jgi:hypothetical protein
MIRKMLQRLFHRDYGGGEPSAPAALERSPVLSADEDPKIREIDQQIHDQAEATHVLVWRAYRRDPRTFNHH